MTRFKTRQQPDLVGLGLRGDVGCLLGNPYALLPSMLISGALQVAHMGPRCLPMHCSHILSITENLVRLCQVASLKIEKGKAKGLIAELKKDA